MPYRLALDIGTNSIGWCTFELNPKKLPEKIIQMGVRVFPDGRDAKTKTSLAVDRRLARGARVRRDRYLRRRKELMDGLVAHGLMPAEVAAQKALENLDPYELRTKGLSHELTMHEFGRCIFHINQRRGFKSNRKTDKDKDAGKIKPAIAQLKKLMRDMDARTYGEFLFKRREAGDTVRSRLRGTGAKADYEFYPERALLEEEFNALWETQAQYHSELTDEARGKLFDIIFYQRPLKPVEPGPCTLDPKQPRAPRALPVAQQFRIYQELNHLRIIDAELNPRPLTLDERNALASMLLQHKTVSFASMRKKLGLDATYTFSHESEKRKGFDGDLIGFILSKPEHFGIGWRRITLENQNKFVERLLDEEDEERLISELQNDWELAHQNALKIANLTFPPGYSRFGRQALEKVTEQLKKDVVSYAEAVVLAGYGSHSDFETGEIWDRLPYYGVVLQRHVLGGSGHPADTLQDRYGRIPNPTVHIALNQVRRVVNEIIKHNGHPDQIIIEVARDLKNSLPVRKKIQQRQAEYQEANDMRREKLLSLGVEVNRDSLLRMRLWEELDSDPSSRRCVYTGERISITKLFSNQVEIEHILPFSRTLDNSPANMTVSIRRANRDKGNHTPFEAFNSSRDYDWQGILARSAKLPKNKQWRFGEDAMERYQKDGDFIDRQLTDTQYISRVAREYLCKICGPSNVWVTPGRLTALLAKKWGFPKKDRDSHFHHAVDAALIGVIDRSVLKRVSDQRAKEIKEAPDRFLAGIEAPWESFRHDVFEILQSVVISHKSDHGIMKRLHNETAYGILGPNGTPNNAVHRVPLSSLKAPADLLRIKGRNLRARLVSFLTGKSKNDCFKALAQMDVCNENTARNELNTLIGLKGAPFRQKLEGFEAQYNIRRVKVIESLTLIPMHDAAGKAYKGYKGNSNSYYSIYCSDSGKWNGEIISTYDANTKKNIKESNPNADKNIIDLFANDMLEVAVSYTHLRAHET